MGILPHRLFHAIKSEKRNKLTVMGDAYESQENINTNNHSVFNCRTRFCWYGYKGIC